MSKQPYKRSNWNEDLIQKINELCENPPEDTECEPLDPLEKVEPKHIWTKQNINDVRDKLTEICSENKFAVELKLWKQEVIDEIETAIAYGWCDCGPKCPNAGANEYQITWTEMASASVSKEFKYLGECNDIYECMHIVDEKCPEQLNFTHSDYAEYRSAGLAAGAATNAWKTYAREVCVHQRKVDELQVELEKLQDELVNLQNELTRLQNSRDTICGTSPGSDACINATTLVTEKEDEITDKEDEITDKEDELEIEEAALLEAETKRDFASEEADANAQRNMSLGISFSEVDFVRINLLSLVLDFNEPWGLYYKCDNTEDNPTDCRVYWIVSGYDSTGSGFAGQDAWVASRGYFTPNGFPYTVGDYPISGPAPCRHYIYNHPNNPGLFRSCSGSHYEETCMAAVTWTYISKIGYPPRVGYQ